MDFSCYVTGRMLGLPVISVCVGVCLTPSPAAQSQRKTVLLIVPHGDISKEIELQKKWRAIPDNEF